MVERGTGGEVVELNEDGTDFLQDREVVGNGFEDEEQGGTNLEEEIGMLLLSEGKTLKRGGGTATHYAIFSEFFCERRSIPECVDIRRIETRHLAIAI